MCGYGRKLQDFENGSVFAARYITQIGHIAKSGKNTFTFLSLSVFSMIEMGDSLKQMADLKYALDDNVKQNFLEPLHHTQTKDLKEVFHHRKKLQGRKLDFDCKKRYWKKKILTCRSVLTILEAKLCLES